MAFHCGKIGVSICALSYCLALGYIIIMIHIARAISFSAAFSSVILFIRHQQKVKKHFGVVCVCVCALMVEQFAISFKWNKLWCHHTQVYSSHSHINMDLERIFFILIMCMFTCKQCLNRKMSFGMGKVTLFSLPHTPSIHRAEREEEQQQKMNKKWLSLLTLYVLFQFNCSQWCSSLLRVRNESERRKIKIILENGVL